MSSSVVANTAANPALDRGRSRAAQLRELHGSMLCLSLAVVACALVFEINDAGRVALRWLPSYPLPELCGSRLLFGVDCPGCGLTRSVLALVAGDLGASLRYHPIGWLLALVIVAQVPYRLFALREMQRGIVERPRLKWLGWSLIAALLVCWLARGAFRTSSTVEPGPPTNVSASHGTG